MLKKLYRHELYSLFRTLWPACLGFLVLAMFARVSFLLPDDLNFILTGAKNSIMLIYILSCGALFVLTLVLVITRFYKHLLTDEGYLTFTLPLSATAHLVCKLVSGVLAILASTFSFLLSLLIFSLGTSAFPDFIVSLRLLYDQLFSAFPPAMVVLYTIAFFVMILLAAINAILMIYAAISIGQQFKSRIGGAVLTFVGFYMASQTVLMMTLVPFMVSSSQKLFGSYTETSFINDAGVINSHMADNLANNGFAFIGTLLTILLLFYLILSLLYFFLTRHMLSRKLNLE